MSINNLKKKKNWRLGFWIIYVCVCDSIFYYNMINIQVLVILKKKNLVTWILNFIYIC